MSSTNLELARRGYEAIRQGDYTQVAELLDEDVKWHFGDPTAIGACRNRSQALAFMQRPGRSPLPEVVELIDAGDRVVVVLQPPPEDGETQPPRAQVTTFRDGKVTEMVGYPTVAAAFAAAGVDRPR